MGIGHSNPSTTILCDTSTAPENTPFLVVHICTVDQFHVFHDSINGNTLFSVVIIKCTFDTFPGKYSLPYANSMVLVIRNYSFRSAKSCSACDVLAVVYDVCDEILHQ